MKPKHKLFLVSHEVWAKDVKQAIRSKGKIFKIELADDKYQPDEEKTTTIGFGTKKKTTPK